MSRHAAVSYGNLDVLKLLISRGGGDSLIFSFESRCAVER